MWGKHTETFGGKMQRNSNAKDKQKFEKFSV